MALPLLGTNPAVAAGNLRRLSGIKCNNTQIGVNKRIPRNIRNGKPLTGHYRWERVD